MAKSAWARLLPGARGVTLAFLTSGTTHLVRPQVFEPLIPPMLPAPRAWIVGSGVAELVSAAGLLTGARWAPAATTATLVAVWPGNWWYAIATQRRSGAHPVHKAVAWARLPMQIPMIAAARDPWREPDPA